MTSCKTIALSPMDFGAKKQEYLSMKESGTVEVIKCEDQEAWSPGLYEGTFKMGSSELKCLIYEFDMPWNAYPTFFLLKPVRHPSLVRHETFYEESGNVKGVILSSVDSSLEKLVTPDQASLFFTSTGSSTSLTANFRTMIVDTCSGLEHLFSLKLYPKKIELSDLYICKHGPKRKRVQILVLEAQKLERKKTINGRKTLLWGHVRSIIEKIRVATKSEELNKFDKRFIQYIGKDVKRLSEYPHSWSFERKGCYLISIIASADMRDVRGMLKTSGLKWPGSKTKTPHLLELLIENASKRRRPYLYCTKVTYDYVLLCRTTLKHFPQLCKDVPQLKAMCDDRKAFLELMEMWEPLIWCILYEAFGLIGTRSSQA